MKPDVLQLADGEQVLATIRRHWFRLAVEGIGYLFLVIVVGTFVGVGEFALSSSGHTQTMSKPLALGLFIFSALGLLMWMRFFALWSDQWLDVWIVTNRRIIDIEQKGFFHREVASFPLVRIQDVTYDVTGIIATWLHFGNVRIHTASTDDDFIMRQVPFPDLVKDHVLAALAQREEGLRH